MDRVSDKVLLHLDGTFFGCRRAIPLMKPTGGSIVNTSSTTALVGYAPYLAYSAAKGEIRSLTTAVAADCRGQKLGIRCNSIHPGLLADESKHVNGAELVIDNGETVIA